jgi:hypothetical protein
MCNRLQQLSDAAKHLAASAERVMDAREEKLRQALFEVGNVDLTTLPAGVVALIREVRAWAYGDWARNEPHPENVERPENETLMGLAAKMTKMMEHLTAEEGNYE